MSGTLYPEGFATAIDRVVLNAGPQRDTYVPYYIPRITLASKMITNHTPARILDTRMPEVIPNVLREV